MNTIVSVAPHGVFLHQHCTLRRVLGLLWDLRGLERFSGQQCTSGAQIHPPTPKNSSVVRLARADMKKWMGESPWVSQTVQNTSVSSLGRYTEPNLCMYFLMYSLVLCFTFSLHSRSSGFLQAFSSLFMTPCVSCGAERRQWENVSGHQTAASYTTKTYPSVWIVNLL